MNKSEEVMYMIKCYRHFMRIVNDIKNKLIDGNHIKDYFRYVYDEMENGLDKNNFQNEVISKFPPTLVGVNIVGRNPYNDLCSYVNNAKYNPKFRDAVKDLYNIIYFNEDIL